VFVAAIVLRTRNDFSCVKSRVLTPVSQSTRSNPFRSVASTEDAAWLHAHNDEHVWRPVHADSLDVLPSMLIS